MSLEFTLKEKMPAGDLLSKNTDQLYELLGLRIKAVEEDPEISGQIELKVEYSDHMGPMDDLKKIGLRMFNKVHTQVYELFCGSNPRFLVPSFDLPWGPQLAEAGLHQHGLLLISIVESNPL